MNKHLITLIFLCLIYSVGYAQRQIHVATSGRDDGDGSQAQPYLTIKRAIAAAQAGDVIKVGAGVYHENVVVTKSNIRFQGEKDANGNWLTIVDGSAQISGWQKAPGLRGTYYREQEEEPWTLVQERNGDTYDVPKQIDKEFREQDNPSEDVHSSRDFNFDKIFNFPGDKVSRTIYMGDDDVGVPVDYWEGIGALYAYRGNKLYLRFRYEDNPNSMIIRYAKDPVFLIKDQSNVIIQDLKLRGGVSGVEISGQEAKNNKVAGCNLINGQQRVLMVNGASGNKIANNRMRMQGVARATGGAWNGGEKVDKAKYAIHEHIYDVYKYEIGLGTGSPNEDSGVDLVGLGISGEDYRPAGNGNEIYGNDIAESLSAIEISGVRLYSDDPGVYNRGTKFYNNIVRDMSSMAVKIQQGALDIEVYDNEFYNINFMCRLQELQEKEERRVFFYRNTFWNVPGVGGSAFYAFYRNSGVNQANEIYIYHNSFAGANRPISTSNKDGVVLENLYLINNIFSTTQGPDRLNGVGQYDYNWCSHANDQRWYGPNNKFRQGEELWPDDSRPDFQLSPDDTDVIGTALDLSQEEVNNRILPGFGPDYYSGEPDMGAIEFGKSSPTAPEPDPPVEPVPPVAAAYASVPPQRANSLEESYWVGVISYEFSDPTGDSDNRVAMKAVWNEQHLVIGVAVNDADLRVFDPTKPWRNDAIDLLFDPTNQQNLNWNPYTGPHRQLVMDVDRGQRSYPQGFGNAASPYLVKGEENYYREVRIPWTALTGKLPQAGDKVGFDIANHDRDSGGKTQFTYTQRTKEFLVPSQFTTLELRGPTTARTAESGRGGIQQKEAEARQLTVYPNPAPTGSPRLRVSGFGKPAQVRIVNTQGQVVYWGTHDASQIDLAQRFPRGLYVVHVSDARGTLTQKLLVE